MNFKSKHTLEHRLNESKRILRKYPDRIPVIVETGSDDLVLDKSKYLVPVDLTAGQFLYVLRKRIKLRPEQGLYMFVNNTIVTGQSLMSDLYAKHRNDDSFVYFLISLENTFG